MGQQTQHDPDLMPLTDTASLADWEGVAAPGPSRLGVTVSVRFDPDSAAEVRSAAANAPSQSSCSRQHSQPRGLRPNAVDQPPP